jgi:uncharacterized protein
MNTTYRLSLTSALVGLLAGTLAPPGAAARDSAPAMEPRISVVTLGVSDLNRSFRFYKDGLGFPTKMTPDGGIVLFATTGARMFLYPFEKLARDAGFEALDQGGDAKRFTGISFGHCVRRRELVDVILRQAEASGGRVIKPAVEASWGGYSGYFSDPDGYLWEVAYSHLWKFNPDGSVSVDE